MLFLELASLHHAVLAHHKLREFDEGLPEYSLRPVPPDHVRIVNHVREERVDSWLRVAVGDRFTSEAAHEIGEFTSACRGAQSRALNQENGDRIQQNAGGSYLHFLYHAKFGNARECSFQPSLAILGVNLGLCKFQGHREANLIWRYSPLVFPLSQPVVTR